MEREKGSAERATERRGHRVVRRKGLFILKVVSIHHEVLFSHKAGSCQGWGHGSASTGLGM